MRRTSSADVLASFARPLRAMGCWRSTRTLMRLPAKKWRSSKVLFFAAMAALLPGLVAPQTIYRSVGSDGKLTYSQTPPEHAKAKAEVIQRPPASATSHTPASEGASSSQSAIANQPGRGVQGTTHSNPAKRALTNTEPATSPRRGSNPLSIDPTASLELSIGFVLGQADLVHRAKARCSTAVPPMASRFDAAARGWDGRNGAKVSKANRVLDAVLSPRGRSRFREDVAVDNAHVDHIASMPQKRQVAHCEELLGMIGGGQVDVDRHPKLTAEIDAY